ncbi:unnamed protein product [Brassicogethes aeneus]|uniref:C2H2-type domain-containing protein n=1 Tax=Brassicogethes aeneus TaxID=1431903 RepID=A0A9P0AQG0_BRAAE|nr:unnamed protein product [Brassicogethes aeneus]
MAQDIDLKITNDSDKETMLLPAYSSLEIQLIEHEGEPISCQKCTKVFWSERALTSHLKCHKKKPLTCEKKFACEVCGKIFKKYCDLDRHMRVHTGEKPSECTICHKRFQQPHNLSKHLFTHLHVKPYDCDVCGKKFGRNDVLNRHMLTHSTDKPFKCEECGKGFIRQSQLEQHSNKHHKIGNV